MLSLTRRLRLLDPRRSLRARFALVLGASGLLLAVSAALLVERIERVQLEASVGQALRREAHLVGQALASSLQDRLSLVRQTAARPLLSSGLVEPGDARLLLEQVRSSQPEIAWMALVDARGRVQVATQALLEGEDLSAERWFQPGLKAPWLGSRHPAGRLTGPFGLVTGAGTPHFLDLAAPVVDAQGRAIGLVVAQIDWEWVAALHHALVTGPDRDAGIDALLLGPDGRIDIGPPALLGGRPALPEPPGLDDGGAPDVLAWPDGKRALSVAVRTPVAGSDSLLTLIARQDEAQAFGPAQRLQLRMLQAGLLATLGFMALSAWLGGRVARPVRALSAAANRLRQGQAVSFELPPEGGGDELGDLAAALHQMDGAVREQMAQRQRAAARYQALFDGSPDAHFVLQQGKVTLVNQAALRLMGADTPQPLVGLTPLQLFHPGDHPLVRERIRRLRDGASHLPLVEERVVRLDGSVVAVESTALTFGSGRDGGVHVVLRDITERQAVSRERARSEERFRLAMRGTAAGLFEWDIGTGRVVYTDTWEQLLGVPLAELPATLADWAPHLRPGDRERVLRPLRALATGEQEQLDTEMLLRHRDGHEVVLLTRAFRAPGTGQAEQRVIGTVLDVTERHQAREALRHLNAELESRVARRTAQLSTANAELDSFAYAVSHDLRAPLRAMSGFAQALREDYGPRLDGQALVFIEHIVNASRHMADLIDGLLTLSRSSRGPLRDDDVDLSALAERTVADLRLAEPGRQVEVRIAPGLRGRGDARMIEVVLSNLVGNAWKYTRDTPEPTIVVDAIEQGGERWFQVADNGAGFDMAHSGLLFKAFQRLHRQDEFPGLGIGLATVQRIVRRHGGTIVAEGARGQGARFRFTLSGHPPAEEVVD